MIFDKDGTLIDFAVMWGGWTAELSRDLQASTGLPIREALHRAFGVDEVTGRIDPHGRLAATPMAVLRAVAVGVVVDAGASASDAEGAVAAAWQPPDPVALARPLADLGALFRALHVAGSLVAIATTDDRSPTLSTLAALGVAGLVDALVCADDGIAAKPAPDMVIHLCGSLSIEPSDAAVVGDSPADLRMGRSAGVRTCVGVLSGTGTAEELGPLADVLLHSIAAVRPGL